MNEDINNKQQNKMKLILIIGIAVLAIGVAVGIIFFSKFNSQNINDKSEKNKTEKIYVNGKIPYKNNIDKSVTGKELEYKDNTRDLSSQSSRYYGEAVSGKKLDLINFSMFLNSDETNVVSYTWDEKEKREHGYEFMEYYLDSEQKHYIYSFKNLENTNAIMLVTSQETVKTDKLNLSNKKEINVNDNILYRGSYGKYYAYQYMANIGELKYSTIYVTFSSDTEEVLNEIKIFNERLHSDNGAPFIGDYLIRNNNVADWVLNVKSYKYVIGANMISKLSEMVGKHDLDVDYGLLLHNEGVNYSRDNSSYYRSDKDVENKVGESIKNGDVELFCSYNSEYNELSIVLQVNGKYTKYYVKNYDSEKQYSYYLNNFNEMLIEL